MPLFLKLLGSKNLLIIILIGVTYFYIHNLQASAVRFELKYNNLVAEIAQKTAIRAAENKLKLATAQKEYEENYKSHVEQLGAVLTNFDDLLKKKGKQNETLENRLAAIGAERDRLRNDIARINAGLPEWQGHAADSATSERSCDAAFDTLKQACIVTTLDFNACRKAFDDNCAVTGCE